MKLFAYWLGGWFTWYAVGAAVVSAAGNVISSQNAKKAAGNVAQYVAPSVSGSQTDALNANLGNENSIENLISQGNSFTANQALNLQNKVMPGYSDLAKTLTSRAQTLAANPYAVPQEVTDNLSRIAAEKGISAGTRGQFNDFSLLRDLGVNELQYGQSNINQASSLTGLLASVAPKVNPMSPLSFYVTPSQALANATGNSQENQAIAQGGINAQNAASNAANQNLWGSLSKIAGIYAGMNGQTNFGNTTDYGSDSSVSSFSGINPSDYTSAANAGGGYP